MAGTGTCRTSCSLRRGFIQDQNVEGLLRPLVSVADAIYELWEMKLRSSEDDKLMKLISKLEYQWREMCLSVSAE